MQKSEFTLQSHTLVHVHIHNTQVHISIYNFQHRHTYPYIYPVHSHQTPTHSVLKYWYMYTQCAPPLITNTFHYTDVNIAVYFLNLQNWCIHVHTCQRHLLKHASNNILAKNFYWSLLVHTLLHVLRNNVWREGRWALIVGKLAVHKACVQGWALLADLKLDY